MKKARYLNCVQSAFIYHLLDPQDAFFISYLIRGLRRYLYLFPGLKNQGFLTHSFQKYFGDSVGILHDPRFLIRDSFTFRKIKARHFLDDDPEFQTYREAFDYFSKLALHKDIKWAYLPVALYYDHRKSFSDSLLKLYMNTSGVPYRKYAKACLKGTLNRPAGNRELLIMDKIKFIEDHSYGYHHRRILGEERMPEYRDKTREFMNRELDDRDYIYLSEFKKSNFQKYIQFAYALEKANYLKEKLNTIKNSKKAKTQTLYFEDGNEKEDKNDQPEEYQEEELNILRLDPGIWTTFQKNNLHSLVFINPVAFDDKTKLWKILNVINPLFYLTLSKRLGRAYRYGSLRFAYGIWYFSFEPYAEKDVVEYGNEIIHYKMTVNNFLDTLYHTLKEREDEE